ncbi:FeoA family protein [Chitiniphilus eburneus]|uniref:Ferrous iron transport protein A n=1 Tax=Chitiniphilus eburneus TaxID=2571148 RepID=A0A4U0QC96_9NEIS|nr:FeoA family protein [Chitiniphilus eburneus]TJZ78916.1 ferrous iron transport protein A [Chitiniphilus eburneus]
MAADPLHFPLPLAALDVPLRVVRLTASGNACERLAGMGLFPGCEVRLTQRQGGNLVVAVGNSRLALGRGLAQQVLVTSEPLSNSPEQS